VETVFELLEVIANVACKLLNVLTDSMRDETEVLTLAKDQRNTETIRDDYISNVDIRTVIKLMCTINFTRRYFYQSREKRIT